MEEAQRTGAGGGFIPVQETASDDDDFVGPPRKIPRPKDGPIVPQPPTTSSEGPMPKVQKLQSAPPFACYASYGNCNSTCTNHFLNG